MSIAQEKSLLGKGNMKTPVHLWKLGLLLRQDVFHVFQVHQGLSPNSLDLSPEVAVWLP